MKSVFGILLLILGSTSGVVAQSYCSLVVKVVDPDGKEVPEAHVLLEEEDGRVISAENKQGGVQFCDLGLRPVTITVGSSTCNQVSVRNVPLEWGQTQAVKVVYDRGPCLRDLPPVAACKILFRFSDEQGRWIPGVAFTPSVMSAVQPRSDDAGRLLIRLAGGAEIRATTKREGYLPHAVHLVCTHDLMNSEQLVKLQAVK